MEAADKEHRENLNKMEYRFYKEKVKAHHRKHTWKKKKFCNIFFSCRLEIFQSFTILKLHVEMTNKTTFFQDFNCTITNLFHG